MTNSRFLIGFRSEIIGTQPCKKLVILNTSKMDVRRDSDVSDGGGCLLVGVTVGKSGSTGNHGGPGFHLANARKI